MWRSPNRTLQASGGCPGVSGKANWLYRSWKVAAKRELAVGMFFQNENTGSASPLHSLAFWFVEGLSAKTLNGTITEVNPGTTNNWQTSAARDPAEPWVSAERPIRCCSEVVMLCHWLWEHFSWFYVALVNASCCPA